MFFNTQPSGNTWFTPVHTLVNINGSVVDVDVDKLALCMDMHKAIPLMKQLTDGSSQSSVHTLFTYASGSVVHVDVDKLALCMDIQGTMHLKKQFTHTCSHSSVHTCSQMVTHGDMQVAV